MVHFQQYLSYIVAVRFIGRENRSTTENHQPVSSTPGHEQDSTSQR